MNATTDAAWREVSGGVSIGKHRHHCDTMQFCNLVHA
jgi:hypothetical protein